MMHNNKRLKPAALALGATFAATVAASGVASATTPHGNPFAMSDLHSGYTQLAEKAKDGKCGEGKCSADKLKAKQKATEGKCGEDKVKEVAKPKTGEGKCGGAK